VLGTEKGLALVEGRPAPPHAYRSPMAPGFVP
jgi:hypothetical protein